MKYRSCGLLESFALFFQKNTGNKCMMMCCAPVATNRPGTSFCNTAQESMENFKRERAELIAESVRFSLLDIPENERKFTTGCARCSNFRSGDHGNFDGLIHHIDLGMTPAPCQCKCIYCGIHGIATFRKRLHADYYEKVFDVIGYAESKGMIAPDATWNVASGEITIHPYKDRILNLVKNRKAMFFTNGFIFDEKIAAILAKNPHSALHLSIDSGTPETWRKVKGVDNFETVTDNLVKYHKSVIQPGQITLKYIVLPDINNNLADYMSVIAIMQVLQIKHLVISRDEHGYDAQDDALISAAAWLAAILVKNGMTFGLYSYTPDECEKIATVGCELLQSWA